MTALRIWWLVRRHEHATSRVPTLLAVIAFAVTTAAALVAGAGYLAFAERARHVDPSDALAVDAATTYTVLAVLACVFMTVPIITLGGIAARLAIARRDERLAAMRLAGATSGQVTVMTLAEAASQALTGAALGTLAYAALLVPLAQIPFDGRPFSVDDLWIGVPWILAALVTVLLLALVSGASSLRQVVVSPLGVARRVTPAPLRLIRVGIAIVALLAWPIAFNNAPHLGIVIVLAVLVAAIASINVIGPWIMMILGRMVASTAQSPRTLLAARRVIDDPKSAWRATSAVGLAVLLAAFSGIAAALSGSDSPQMPHLSADLATGTTITLIIVMTLAATSSGAVQAAKVFDQRAQYRALAYAGVEPRTILRVRRREVMLPLAGTILLIGSFASLLILPLGMANDPLVIVRFAAGVIAAVALMLAGLAASRGLVRASMRIG